MKTDRHRKEHRDTQTNTETNTQIEARVSGYLGSKCLRVVAVSIGWLTYM